MGKVKIKKSDIWIDMTPMSDVMTLLLTFFMLTSTFVKNEPVKVNTPGSVSEIKVPENGVLTILVSPEKDAAGKPTGEGINDIFALITNGTGKQARVYGYWTYYSEGMGYGAEETWTRAWLPRRGKPFIEAIIKHYEAVNPGLKIEYPPNWR